MVKGGKQTIKIAIIGVLLIAGLCIVVGRYLGLPAGPQVQEVDKGKEELMETKPDTAKELLKFEEALEKQPLELKKHFTWFEVADKKLPKGYELTDDHLGLKVNPEHFEGKDLDKELKGMLATVLAKKVNLFETEEWLADKTRLTEDYGTDNDNELIAHIVTDFYTGAPTNTGINLYMEYLKKINEKDMTTETGLMLARSTEFDTAYTVSVKPYDKVFDKGAVLYRDLKEEPTIDMTGKTLEVKVIAESLDLVKDKDGKPTQWLQVLYNGDALWVEVK